MRRSILPWTVLVVLAGCAEPAVEIIGSCETTSPEVELPLDFGEHVTSVGMIGEHVLVTTVTSIEPIDPEAERTASIRSRWLDGSLQPVGEPIEMGVWRDVPAAGRFRWQRVGDTLVAQVISDPEGAIGLEHDVDLVHVWTQRPPPDAGVEVSPVDVPVRPRGDGTGELWLSGLYQSALDEASTPAAVIDGAFTSAFVGSPAACFRDDTHAVFVVSRSDGAWDAHPVHWGEMFCGSPGPLHTPSSPWLVPLPAGGAGLLFRPDDGREGHVRWVRLSQAPEPLGAPSRVGAVSPYQTGFGAQPRGIAFGDGHVVMTERPLEHDRCRTFRVFDLDGSDAHDGPWRLPCSEERRNDVRAVVTRRITRFLEIERIGEDGAVVVYSDAREERWAEDARPSAIRAALLTSRGQRGSETLTLSDDAGPSVSSFLVTATDGDTGVVVWSAGRARARRFACSFDE